MNIMKLKQYIEGMKKQTLQWFIIGIGVVIAMSILGLIVSLFSEIGFGKGVAFATLMTAYIIGNRK